MPKTEKGSSHSIRPVAKRPPVWCKYTPEEVEAFIIKLAREGHSSGRIGVILRDQYGLPLAKPISGKTITDTMRQHGFAPAIPEDLEVLLKKASGLIVHLEKNRNDSFNTRALQAIEAKIHKLSKYYKRKGILTPDWKYEPKTASLV